MKKQGSQLQGFSSTAENFLEGFSDVTGESPDSRDGFSFTLRNDYAFKKLFSSAEGRPVLQEFLSLVLQIPKEDFAEIVIENPFTQPNYKEDKQGILDIKLTLQSGKKINLEMQNRSHGYFPERILFYWASRYMENFLVGEHYMQLRKCIMITLLNDSFPFSSRLHSTYRILEANSHREFGDLLELHFLNLSLLVVDKGESIERLTDLEKWLLFIQTRDSEVRDMLAKQNDTLDYANKTMNRFFSTREERLQYEAAFRYECDRASLLEEGQRLGMEQGKIEVARNLLGMGISIPDICSATGLSEEVILRL